MIRRTFQAASRALSPGLRRFSDTSGGEVIEFERTGSADLTRQASLYVHWPYCLKRCSYCNFNKYIARENKDNIMTECLQRETETLLQLSQISCITSVFFGGGTPSLAHPSTIAAVLDTVSRQSRLSDKAEVSLEVNPTPVGMSRLEDFCRAGVNRFSIGVQSLQDEDLKILGRDHSSYQALQTIEEARRLCPGRVSVDVIFGRPKQTIESWENELTELLKVCDDHVSLYQLTLERGTHLFKQVQRGEVSVPADDVTAEMYQCARRTLQQHGFLQYEVSNFARHSSRKMLQEACTIASMLQREKDGPAVLLVFLLKYQKNSLLTKKSAVSHHNMSYWQGKQYIGVGPGAHGRFVVPEEGGVTREARTQTLEPDVWMSEVQRRGHGTRRRIRLGHLELLEEVLVMGLRMTEGIQHKHWELFSPEVGLRKIFGTSLEVREFLQSGKLILDDRGLRCSWDGLTLLDSLLPALLVELDRGIRPSLQRERCNEEQRFPSQDDCNVSQGWVGH